MQKKLKHPCPQKRILTLILFVCLCSSYKAQFDLDYKPLESSASIPKDYPVDVIREAKISAEGNTLMSKKISKNYFTELFYLKKQIFDAGDVYLPNALTKYIDTLSSALLNLEPSIKEKVKVYVTRYSSPNAFCLSDGSIFINIGLIKLLENESELAFVLAHEMAHFKLQHSIKDYAKTIAIKQKEKGGSSSYNNSFRQLRFSRESELEADGYAINLMVSAGFEISMSTKALTKLKNGESNFEIDLEKTFNNTFFTLDTSMHLSSLLKNVKESLKSRDQNNNDSKIDDLYETHPDIDKRISSIDELMRNIKPASTLRKNKSYSYYKTQAHFEICNNNMREQDYINTLINSLELMKSFPENMYLMANVAKSLYWISYYKELSKGDLLVYGDLHQNTENYYALYTLFDRISLKDAKQLSYAFLRSREEQTNKVEALSFYLSLCTENYLGKVASQQFYRSYLSKFPEGTYSAFVKNKLK